MKPFVLIREPALLVTLFVLLLAAGAVGLQLTAWARARGESVPVANARQTSLPPVEIRWGEEMGGIRLGTRSGQLDVASLEDLPVFIENRLATFVTMDVALECGFHALDIETSLDTWHWCKPLLLNDGQSLRERTFATVFERVMLPPHSVCWLNFDGFGEQIYWRTNRWSARRRSPDKKLNREWADQPSKRGVLRLFRNWSASMELPLWGKPSRDWLPLKPRQ